VSVVIGIPHVKREEEVYLFSSLFSLISAMSPDEKDDCLIVVFVAEVLPTLFASLVINLRKM
jgi:hypothetical protein